eukprot:TRINITY_DN4878_c0_g4_i1.p1 TRINITY_DN4878_c0_g4~~TRINITY_DN4878_c0_g4_i1.p1  ORF type:complete len:472 (-),score=60.83 TRINITY_DN4878_c0_g4_i1:41-1372(-)
MADNQGCDCDVCVFGRQPEIEADNYPCDEEMLVSDLAHEHDAVRYVGGNLGLSCSKCRSVLGGGGLRCQQPDCLYALCLQCLPMELNGACWDSDRFVDQDACKEFECVLCHDICKQIVELECGHVFGAQCMQHMMQARQGRNLCPLCQRPFNAKKVHPNRYARLKILSFDAYCIHKPDGCSYRGALASVLRHQFLCPHRQVTCTLPSCQATFPHRLQATHHLHHCMMDCPAPDCGFSSLRADLSDHVLQHHFPRLQSSMTRTLQRQLEQHKATNTRLERELKSERRTLNETKRELDKAHDKLADMDITLRYERQDAKTQLAEQRRAGWVCFLLLIGLLVAGVMAYSPSLVDYVKLHEEAAFLQLDLKESHQQSAVFKQQVVYLKQQLEQKEQALAQKVAELAQLRAEKERKMKPETNTFSVIMFVAILFYLCLVIIRTYVHKK